MSDINRWLRLAGAVLWLAGSVSPAHCDDQEINRARANQLKAAFLYKFSKFVEWPLTEYRAASGPIQICILEPDPFGADIDRIAQLNDPAGREAQIQRLKSYESAQDCHLLYLAQGADLKKILPAIRGWSVVTVSDAGDFLQAGGIIELNDDRKTVSFKINQREAHQEGIKISSKLLFLAKEVIKD